MYNPLKIKKAVIPAAGLGTRLLPLSKAVPKELLPVGEKPCIQWVVEELAEVGVEEILFIVSEAKHCILRHFTDDPDLRRKVQASQDPRLSHALDYLDLGLSFTSVVQRPLLGLGHSIALAEEFTAGDPFVVALGDAIIKTTTGERVVSRMIEALDPDTEFCVAVRNVPDEDVRKYGIVEVDNESVGPMRIRSLVEKPDPSDTSSRLAVSGRYVFTSRIFEALRSVPPGKGGEIQLTDAMNLLVQMGGKGLAVKLSVGETRFDIGNYEDYRRAVLSYVQ